jgi:homoserine kinase type II
MWCSTCRARWRPEAAVAVYTDVSFEELEAWLPDFGIGTPTSFKGIAEGVENSNYYLRTDTGVFILTLYEKRVQARDLPFFLGLMEHLARRRIPCPVPVRNGSGSPWAMLNGKAAAILWFLDGVSVRQPTAEHCAAGGAALAEMHMAGTNFALTRANTLGLDGWRKLADTTQARADRVAPGLGALIAETMAQLESAWPRDLPSGIIHADLFPDNVLFMNGKVSGLIDFYFACNDAFAYDLAVMLNSWCFEPDGSFNVTKSKNVIAAYRARRPLSDMECAAIPILARGAALRFLLTRLFDWLNPDANALVRPKDPREFARRLRFHQGTKSAAEYGL